MVDDREGARELSSVIGAPIDSLNWEKALGKIYYWVEKKESRYICICNAHSIVTARQDRSYSNIIHAADMATPDGAPVAWLMRRMGDSGQKRINGPDLMWRYCAEASQREESIYLFGSTPETLQSLEMKLLKRFPKLTIAGSYSPPFRQLTVEEKKTIVENINASGAGTVWVSLGCPKQEKWMAEHRGLINAVMIGVGAAFDYHAGTIRRAPIWMQNCGLEWSHRLFCEPRRLWKRYLVTNSLFIFYSIVQLAKNLSSYPRRQEASR